MINGLIYDFESIELMSPTGHTFLVESIAYSDDDCDSCPGCTQLYHFRENKGEYYVRWDD
jgi:hypothetical protein